MTKRADVCISNQLHPAFPRSAGVDGRRLLFLALAKINRLPPPLRDPSEGDIYSYSVTAKEFSDAYGVAMDNAYSTLKAMPEKIKDHHSNVKFWIDGTTPLPQAIQAIRWFDSITYADGEARIDMRFTKAIAPYLYHPVAAMLFGEWPDGLAETDDPWADQRAEAAQLDADNALRVFVIPSDA